jgi:hypothetical protein
VEGHSVSPVGHKETSSGCVPCLSCHTARALNSGLCHAERCMSGCQTLTIRLDSRPMGRKTSQWSSCTRPGWQCKPGAPWGPENLHYRCQLSGWQADRHAGSLKDEQVKKVTSCDPYSQTDDCSRSRVLWSS